MRAIKMTLYRTAKDSEVIKHLIAAARNGKQVAVVLELKARFDEEANIKWAPRMERAGIHVTYGVVGLKTHCKVILVVRQDYDSLRRYAHLGTGNYHAGTELRLILDIQLGDQRSSWDMRSDGSYAQRDGGASKSAQERMIDRAEKRLKEATRLKRRRVRGVAKRKVTR